MSKEHSHSDQNHSNIDRNLRIGIILNSGFTIFEFIIGFISGSLALISDAAHNLTDSLSLLISFSANKLAQRQANLGKTYGYGRATILAALLNAVILLGLAVYIFYEAYQRIMHPTPVEGVLVVVVALLGAIINGTNAVLFFKDRNDLNAHSVYINMAFDTLASIGAAGAGLIIIFSGKTIADPLASILIGVLMIIGSWGVIQAALHILLEGVPKGVDIQAIKEMIMKFPLVKTVDDLHVWAISSQYAALSCHLVIEECDLDKSMKLVEDVKNELKDKFKIQHATIETELIECL